MYSEKNGGQTQNKTTKSKLNLVPILSSFISFRVPRNNKNWNKPDKTQQTLSTGRTSSASGTRYIASWNQWSSAVALLLGRDALASHCESPQRPPQRVLNEDNELSTAASDDLWLHLRDCAAAGPLTLLEGEHYSTECTQLVPPPPPPVSLKHSWRFFVNANVLRAFLYFTIAAAMGRAHACRWVHILFTDRLMKVNEKSFIHLAAQGHVW